VNERFAIVTGGSAGIGARIVAQMAEAGYTVISMARRAPASASAQVIPVAIDLADPVATREQAIELAARYPVTTIVHNAGSVREKPVDQVTQLDLTALGHLHLSAPLALVQANLATMRAQHYGRILLMSTRAVLGLANRTAYSTTKAGMLGMARTWALELAADGITCNVVCPGPIAETEMFHEIIPADSPKIPKITESVPVRRLGRPDDVSRAVMFFIDPQAGFVTGQTLFVCGGTSVGSITY
jgi:NAD(P)-dependent dehydrogenase (short-subunit alcohol dehydrogenase family)